MTTYAEPRVTDAAPATVYVRPGSSGSMVPLTTRYENFIGSDWLAPARKNYAEAITIANETIYGLGSGVWGRDTDLTHEASEDIFA